MPSRAGLPIRSTSRAVLEPEHEDAGELAPLGGGAVEAEDGARRRRLLAAGRLDPGLGDRAQVADEVAGRAVRLAPRPGRGQLGQAARARAAARRPPARRRRGAGGAGRRASTRRRTKTSARRSSITAEAVW